MTGRGAKGPAAPRHEASPGDEALGVWGRALRGVSMACAVLGGVGVMALMAIINADVIGRGGFGVPFPAAAEIISASIVAIIFLQLPLATGEGRSIRSDMLLERLRARAPRAGDALDAVHHLAGAMMLAVLIRYVAPEILEIVHDAETVGLFGILQLPRWPFVAPVLVGCVLTFLHYLRLAFLLALRARRGGPA